MKAALANKRGHSSPKKNKGSAVKEAFEGYLSVSTNRVMLSLCKTNLSSNVHCRHLFLVSTLTTPLPTRGYYYTIDLLTLVRLLKLLGWLPVKAHLHMPQQRRVDIWHYKCTLWQKG